MRHYGKTPPPILFLEISSKYLSVLSKSRHSSVLYILLFTVFLWKISSSFFAVTCYRKVSLKSFDETSLPSLPTIGPGLAMWRVVTTDINQASSSQDALMLFQSVQKLKNGYFLSQRHILPCVHWSSST